MAPEAVPLPDLPGMRRGNYTGAYPRQWQSPSRFSSGARRWFVWVG